MAFSPQRRMNGVVEHEEVIVPIDSASTTTAVASLAQRDSDLGRLVNNAVRSIQGLLGGMNKDVSRSLGPLFKTESNIFNSRLNSGGGPLLAGTNLNFFNSSPAHDDVMARIFHVDPAHQRQHILDTWADGELVPGTCRWLERMEQYQRWLTLPAPQAMWLTGRPGMGKTFLAAHLSGQLQTRVENKGGGTVIWYFFDSEDKLRSTAEGALRSMIWMICRKRPKLLHRHVVPEMVDRGKDGERLTLELWWTIFENLISDSECGEIYCVLDGLDNCGDGSFHNLLVRLQALCSIESKPLPHFRLIIASQQCSNLLSEASIFEHIDLEQNEGAKNAIKKDILMFIDYKLNRLAKLRNYRGWSENFMEFMRSEFKVGAGLDFLWVNCVAKTIEIDSRNEADARDILENAVPKQLEDLYTQMLHKINNQSKPRRKLARKILQTVLFAYRPLSLEELGVLVGEDKTTIPLKLHMEERIRSCCSYMLVVGERITFSHPTTVRLFLEREFEGSKYDRHANICKTCFGCVDKWAEERCLEEQVDDTIAYNPNERMQISQNWSPLLDYAIRYWPEHLRVAGAIDRKKVEEIMQSAHFWADSSPRRDTWLNEYWRQTMPYWKPPIGFGSLHFAAYFGLDWQVHHLLDDQNPLTARNMASLKTNFGMAAIHWGARNGHLGVVNSLLQWSRNLEDEGYKMTPLHWAVVNRHIDISKALIEAGANIEAIAFGKTPLHWAICDGNKDLVEVLLILNAKTEARAVPPDISAAIGILRATFSAISWTTMLYKSAQTESRADAEIDSEWREGAQRSEDALRLTVTNASVFVLLAFTGLSYLLANTWVHLKLFLESLGWKLDHFAWTVTALLSLWAGVGVLYKIGRKSLAAKTAIVLCAGWAGLLSGQAVMLVAATVCCSPDEMVEETMTTFTNFMRRWARHIAMAIITLAVVQIWLVGVIGVVFLCLWAIFLSLWAAIPGIIVWIDLVNDDGKEWGVLAIPFLGFAVAALVVLVSHLVTYGNGAEVVQRWWIYFLAFICAGSSGGFLIWLKPVPSIAGNTVAHIKIALLGAVWALFGVSLSIIVAEVVKFAPFLYNQYQISFGRGLQDPTALMLAIQNGHVDIVRLLLKHGAKIRAKDAKGRSALELAEFFEKQEIANLIRERIQRNTSSRS